MRSTIIRSLVAASIAGAVCSGSGMAQKPATVDRPLLFGVVPVAPDWLIQEGQSYTDEVWYRLAQAGVRCVRLGVSWREVEAKKGNYQWGDLDDQVKRCRRYGIEPICLIVNTPAWASPTGKPVHDYGPKPEAIPDWYAFCRKLAERYRTDVRRYEIWNEQNGFGWHDFNDVEEYLPVLRSAYRALHRGNPKCLVAVGGMDDPDLSPEDTTGWRGAYFMRRLYEAGGKIYFDAVADHPYSSDLEGNFRKKVTALRRVMVENGDADKPMWFTEFGWHTGGTSLEEQARLYKKWLDMLLTDEFKYVTAATYLSLADFENAVEGFGLCDSNLQPRPAYFLLQSYPKGDTPDIYEIFERDVTPREAYVYCRTQQAARTELAYHELGSDVVKRRSLLQRSWQHSLAFMGLKPGTVYEYSIHALTEDGKTAEAPGLVLCTPADYLRNGGFEGGFRAGLPYHWKCSGLTIWLDGGQHPDVKHARSGEHSAAATAQTGRMTALMQQIVFTSAGARHRFSVWSRAETDAQDADALWRRIGIDPKGGSDPEAEGVVWSDRATARGDWVQQSVEAAADGERITLFIQGEGNTDKGRQQIVWDDAELTTQP
jgi:hypothetical protein